MPIGALAILALIVVVTTGGGGGGSGHGGSSQRPRYTESLSVQSARVPLPAPVSGESAVAARGGPLIIGGLDSTETSVGGVFQLPPGSGGPREVGSLTGPLHDAAAVALGGQVLVFGGGTETSTDEVQALSMKGGSIAPGTVAREVGRLPTVRSDLSAVTVGSTAYVLGGYDGNEPIPSVLSTADGSSFREVTKLPVPARYLAVATLGGRIYAFGGETGNGAASDAIQEIDPKAGTARVIGHLPAGVYHASAVTIGNSIYVLGGEANGRATERIWRFRPGQKGVVGAGTLPQPTAGGAAATVGKTSYLIGGTGSGGTALADVVELTMQRTRVPEPDPEPGAGATTGSAPTWPFAGQLMIADRGNDRLLVVDAKKKILWRFPSKEHPAPPGGFYFPDDAFFIHGGHAIISNEEQNERIVQLSYPGGRLLWSYGHPGATGSEPGYLHEPDDAYLLKNGNVSVADAQNCRVLLISPAKKVLQEIGSPEACTHEPPTYLGSPNGDTPLADGNILVSEVNGSYIDEITPQGKLIWTVQLPIEYPSDPQQLGPDRYLVADYAKPGGIYEFNRAGQILWSYSPESGNGMLNHPSLAERLPNGLIAANDDYRDRVVIIDPKTQKIVWQYGVTGKPGTGPDHLKIPDGFDLLAPNGTTPTHPFTG
ncbi:MAG: PQQ-binding-like beta-propeller repeat protein [Actinobacteria bacterium]|nr:PQQ-binding-like beta-propeller repeat protein [Actinomycetota bacterium]